MMIIPKYIIIFRARVIINVSPALLSLSANIMPFGKLLNKKCAIFSKKIDILIFGGDKNFCKCK